MLRNLSSSDLLNVCCRNRLLKDEVRLFQLKAKDNKHSSSTCNLPIFELLVSRVRLEKEWLCDGWVFNAVVDQ